MLLNLTLLPQQTLLTLVTAIRKYTVLDANSHSSNDRKFHCFFETTKFKATAVEKLSGTHTSCMKFSNYIRGLTCNDKTQRYTVETHAYGI